MVIPTPVTAAAAMLAALLTFMILAQQGDDMANCVRVYSVGACLNTLAR